MNKYLIIVISFLSLNVASALDLKPGDVLLISFNCYECRVIESETNSNFSHSGIAVKTESNEIKIAQSLGKVALYSLSDFLKPITPNSNVAVYRPKDLLNLNTIDQKKLEQKMIEVFNSKFSGAPFDTQYIWDNFDSKGSELLYCSEFIAKFIDNFLNSPTIPYPLTYEKNKSYWLKYFKGVIPEGEIGNSPAAFSRDDRFVFVGNL
jgi:hypothetical protein